MKYIDKMIEKFNKEESFNPYAYDFHRFIIKKRPDCFAVKYLRNSLSKSSEHTALQIVRLLEDLSIRTDPFNQTVKSKHNVDSRLVRDADVIDIFLDQLIKDKFPDVSSACYDILYKRTPRGDLVPFTERMVSALERKTSWRLFDLVAKTGSTDAFERVQNVARRPKWISNESAYLCLAALGDKKYEQSEIQKFETEKDVREKVYQARTMAHIGTHNALYALGSLMRSSLKIEIVGTFVRSIRIDLIEVLQHAFPTEEILYKPIESDEDYKNIEHFLENELGIQWTVERPPFLTELPLAGGASYE